MGAFPQHSETMSSTCEAFKGTEIGRSHSLHMYQAGNNAICLPFVEGCIFSTKTLP